MATRRKGGDPRIPQQRPVRTCSTMEMHRRLARQDAKYRAARRQIEYEIKQWMARYWGGGLRLGIVRIPVVVHVVYNTAVQNISNAQIQSQIDVLNADYRLLNADAAGVPAAFQPVVADARIEFGLALRAPDCSATIGITRTQTAITLFTPTLVSEQKLKSTAAGGADPWPNDRYLNIWVCNYSTLGYGRYPGAPPNLDGVVIWHEAFGTTGTAAAPFNLGRTATHEIGHWLNLWHLWGDDDDSGAACERSDEVADTPTQLDANTGCPAFPHVSCNNGPNGDMFMNYMDYTDDGCMFMFTAGQAERMNATLQITRNSILSSDGLIPPPGVNAPDLWSRNSPSDVGTEPDPSPGPVYLSDDIWARRGSDGFSNQDHENPQYRASGTPNYVYVRVRNRGCPSAGAQGGTLRLYWAKASPSLSWPVPWDGSVTIPALMGGPIGSQPVTLDGGSEDIYQFSWSPPNPADYAAFGAGRSHFCLLARIETATTPPYGMTLPETNNLGANVRNNNNIAWKNITVLEEEAGGGARSGSFILGSFAKDKSFATILFQAPEDEKPSIFEWGQIVVEIGDELYDRWVKAGKKAASMELLGRGRIAISKSGARLESLPLVRGDFDAVQLQVIPAGRIPGARVFALDAIQLDEKNEFVGGQRFYLRIGPQPGEFDTDHYVGLFDGVSWNKKPQAM
jgi:hypothetical protein